jgi:hypothetical protein
MPRYIILHAAFACMAIVACMRVAALDERGAQAPVYTITAIDQHLRPALPRWLQRPVRVRAIADWCPADIPAGPAASERCMDMPPMLLDATDGTSPPLLLVQEAAPGPFSFLSRLLPSQAPRWGHVEVYRIQVVEIPFANNPCQRRPCYGARLATAWD